MGRRWSPECSEARSDGDRSAWTADAKPAMVASVLIASKFLFRRFCLALIVGDLSGGSFGLTVQAAATSGSKLPPPATGKVDFTKDVQPLLAKTCYECHGPEKQKAGLRLDQRAAALNGGEAWKGHVMQASTAAGLNGAR